jgi:P4 family phage/plasmid primase-like protien
MNTVLGNNPTNTEIHIIKKSNKPAMSKHKSIFELLKPYFKTSNDATVRPTNTRIGNKDLNITGGSYIIPDDKYNEFLNEYYDLVIARKTPEYLTEIQLENNGPLLIDIDLRHDLNTDSHHYTNDHITDFINSVLEELKKIYQMDETTKFPIFVFEKSSVKKLPEKNLTKDGIHMIFGFQCDHVTQQILRKQMIKNIAEMWSDLPIICAWEDVLDEGISTGKVPWQLYGSTKPGYEPYAITKIYEVSFDPTDEEFIRKNIKLEKFNLKQNFAKLSARYKEHPSFFFKNSFINERNLIINNNEINGSSKSRKHVNNNITNPMKTNLLQVKNKEELDIAINEFLDNIVASSLDYKLREAYDYTMTLPEAYYGTGSFSKWIAVGWALRNISDQLFIVWIAFSAQYSQFDYREIPTFYEKWVSFDNKNPMGLTERSIMYWSKIDAPDKYKKVRENSIFYYIDKTLETTTCEVNDGKFRSCGDFDLAYVLYHLYKDEYKCISVKANIWYTYKNHRWEEIDSGTTLRKSISMEMRDIYQEMIRKVMNQMAMDPNEEKQKVLKIKNEKIKDICLRLARTNDKKNIMTEAKELFYDGAFLQRIDTNPYLLCFNNGVIDFKTKTFRKGYPEDYISKSTNIDYIPLHPTRHLTIVNEIQDFMNKLFPVEELKNYMWEHLASVLIGTSSNQTFNMYIGGGSNGKSVLITLMELILGEYKGDVPLSLITDKRTRIGGLAPEMVALKGLRYAVMQEPQKGDKINEGVMKQITSGIDPIQARAPYMLQSITFIPQFKLVVCANVLMEIKSQDHGTWRRIRLVDFMTLFTDKPIKGDVNKPYQFQKIDNITEKFEEWKEVFMSMLVEKAFETNGVVKDCPTVMKSSNNYRESQDFIAEFIADRIILDPLGTMTKSEIKAEFEMWYQGTYGKGIPSMKDVHADMDKRFGKFTEKNKCWKGGRINYDRGEMMIENNDIEEEEEEDLSIDMDNEKL